MWDILLQNKENILKLFLAAIVGGFTGYEREKSKQFAGFRTHILVAIGSCITSIIALDLFNEYSSISTMDPARLPAQVLSGIGFLGAGAILKNSNGIRGLTTAAGIWATACIGIAIGYGQYILGISAWLLVMVTLYILKNIDKIIAPKKETILKAKVTRLDVVSTVFNTIKANEIMVKNFQITPNDDNVWEMSLFIKYDRRIMLDELVNQLKNIKYVIDIEYVE